MFSVWHLIIQVNSNQWEINGFMCVLVGNELEILQKKKRVTETGTHCILSSCERCGKAPSTQQTEPPLSPSWSQLASSSYNHKQTWRRLALPQQTCQSDSKCITVGAYFTSPHFFQVLVNSLPEAVCGQVISFPPSLQSSYCTHPCDKCSAWV